MKIVWANEIRAVNSQNRCERQCVGISRIENRQRIDFIADQMDLVHLAQAHVGFQSLWRIASSYFLLELSAMSLLQGLEPSGLCGLHKIKALALVPFSLAAIIASSNLLDAATEKGSTPSMGT